MIFFLATSITLFVLGTAGGVTSILIDNRRLQKISAVMTFGGLGLLAATLLVALWLFAIFGTA